MGTAGRITTRPIFAKDLLDRKKVLIDEGLYVKHDLKVLDRGALFLFKHSHQTIDGYCPGCRAMSVFHNGEAIDPEAARTKADATFPGSSCVETAEGTQDETFMSTLQCSRALGKHKLEFYFVISDGVLQKVGQVPSHGDLAISEFNRFKTVLAEASLKELKRGMELNTHRYGIGAFVYVRRVFESLIDQAHDRAVASGDWDDSAYLAAQTTNERITVLAAFLPEVLVRNAAYYGILSKGVHELQEDECLRYFPVVKEGIEVILERLIEDRERNKREEAFTSAVGKVASEIGKPTKE